MVTMSHEVATISSWNILMVAASTASTRTLSATHIVWVGSIVPIRTNYNEWGILPHS